jgi:hypothetical protein
MRNRILFNSIFDNDGLGIDLGADGVTPNDNRDPDTGGNALQNFPTLIQAATTGGKTTIEGRLNSTPNKTFTIQFFSNPMGDISGFGEGKTFIGQRSVTTNANGNATFSFTATQRVRVGHWVTATATDTLGNTSEFLEAVVVDDQLCPC